MSTLDELFAIKLICLSIGKTKKKIFVLNLVIDLDCLLWCNEIYFCKTSMKRQKYRCDVFKYTTYHTSRQQRRLLSILILLLLLSLSQMPYFKRSTVACGVRASSLFVCMRAVMRLYTTIKTCQKSVK